ncbi:MAG: hypothetical protein CMM52_08480 [Rhodospirillaceae bacterium]|nr:hypothetical protein [Rhodospirillaceae bacterium]|tara:strand:+ start:35684 stop:36061 length:378 start_codon:yes stop_codon:yes gene_type:complete
MADITPPVSSESQVIQGYGDGGFRIAGHDFDGSVIVTAQETSAWSARSVEDIDPKQLISTLSRAAELNILLLGTGKSIEPLEPGLRIMLREQGIGLDVMDTGAACRTFNVLLAEGRSVAAALIGT